MVPKHMRINANETADELATQGSSPPLIGPNPMLGTSVKGVEGGESGIGKVGNMKSIGSPLVDKGKLRSFSKHSPKQAGELLNLTKTSEEY